MQAAALDDRARRERKRVEIRADLVRRFGVVDNDLDGLSLLALFELRCKLVQALMQPSYGR